MRQYYLVIGFLALAMAALLDEDSPDTDEELTPPQRFSPEV